MCRGTPCAGSSALGEPRSFHDSAGWKGALAGLCLCRNWFGLAEIILLLGWCSLLTWSGARCQCNSSPGSLAGLSSAQRGTSRHGTVAARSTRSTQQSPEHPQLTWARHPWLTWAPPAHLCTPAHLGTPGLEFQELFASCRGMLEHSRSVGKDRSSHLPSSAVGLAGRVSGAAGCPCSPFHVNPGALGSLAEADF